MRYATALAGGCTLLLVLLFASELFTLASDAGSFSATGASEFFNELPTMFYVLAVAAIGSTLAGLLVFLVRAGGRG